MNYLSVCSGIEAASVAWKPLGWDPVAFSETAAFPSAVLQHHYPAVPNWGDMTKFKEWPNEPVDVLIGGTPCQAFSISGLREGLADPRGQLTLTFLAIAEKYKPKWIVWENVPGVISSDEGKTLTSFLDGLESLGYIIDIEILDAQNHNIPQRRRRVYVCAQHRDHMINQRTNTSALTIAQCLMEILHGICTEGLLQYGNAPQSSEYKGLSRDGSKRRMKLLGITGEENCSYHLLLKHLEEVYQKSPQGQEKSAFQNGESDVVITQEEKSLGLKEEAPSLNTGSLWKKCLEESYEVMRSCITSTETNQITQKEIFSCSQAALIIGKLIVHWSQSSPLCWSAASSALISLQEFTNYARSADSDLFARVDGVYSWNNFYGEAVRTIDLIKCLRIECFGKVQPVTQALSGNTAKNSKEAETFTGTLPSRHTDDSGIGIDFECSNDPTPIVMASGQQNSEIGIGLSPTITAAHDLPMVFQAVVDGEAVRQLTPREWERLMGFPDDYTLIPYRKKMAADTPRYRAIGNSIAVPVLRWIGERIQMVEGLER